MQLRYVFSELGQGLRRNLSMHVAVILTLFVSLTLVGLGVLLHQQADKAAEQWGNQLQITVFLCRDGDDNPACLNEVTGGPEEGDREGRRGQPRGRRADTSSPRSRPSRRSRSSSAPRSSRARNPAATATTCPSRSGSRWRTPKSTRASSARSVGLDGVSTVRDQRDVVGPILRLHRGDAVGCARRSPAFLVVAALLLVANTIRLAAFARRKEIGIMRLVGASTLYIALPFLLEALVTALIGVALAGGALAAFMYFGVEQPAQGLRRVHPVDRDAGILVRDRWSSRSSGRCSRCFRHSC